MPGASSVNPVLGKDPPKPSRARTQGFRSALSVHYGPKHTGPSCLQRQPEAGEKRTSEVKRCSERLWKGDAPEHCERAALTPDFQGKEEHLGNYRPKSLT